MKRILIKYILALLLFTTCTNSTLQAQWVNFGPDGKFYKIKKVNGVLFGLGQNRLFYSLDNGENWQPTNGTTTEDVVDISFCFGKYYVSATSTLYSFDMLNAPWTRLNAAFNASYSGVYEFNNRIFVTGTSLFYSDDGLTFVPSTYPGGTARGMTLFHDTLFTLISGGAIYSIDNGVTFSPCLNSGYISGSYVGTILSYNNKLFCMGGTSGANNIYESVNAGNSWYLSNPSFGNSVSFHPISIIDGILYAFMLNGSFKYDTLSQGWNSMSSFYNPAAKLVLGFNGNRYFSRDLSYRYGDALMYSDDSGLNWNKANGVFTGAAFSGLKFRSNTLICFNTIVNNFVGGYEWSALDTNISISHTSLCYAKNSSGIIFIGTNKGVFKSTDNTLTWTQHTNGLPGSGSTYYVNDILVWGDTVLVGTDSGPYISYNGALSFTSAFSSNGAVQQFLQVGNRLYASGGNALIRSSNRGVTWTSTGVSGGHDLAWAGSKLFKGDASYTYMSDTGSIAFTTLGYNVNGGFGGAASRSIVRIAAYDSLFFVTGDGGYIVKKMNINSPGTFTDVNANLPIRVDLPIAIQDNDYSGSSLLIHDNKLWLGTLFGSTFYRPLTDFGLVVTESTHVPYTNDEVRLYPNPAVHTFSVQLPFAPQQVMVNLYDISGRLVLTESVQTQEGLITLSMPPGKLPEGLYTVLIQTGNQDYRQKLVVKRE